MSSAIGGSGPGARLPQDELLVPFAGERPGAADGDPAVTEAPGVTDVRGEV